MAERDLVVRIIGDEKDLKRAFASSERSAKQFSGRLERTSRGVGKGFVAGIAAGFSVDAILGGIQKSITAASDLNEQISRTEVILGSASDETIAWSKTTADSFGISQRAALAANATFAGLFQTVGLGQAEAGQLSRRLVELAADLASLQNSSPEEALVALRSGLAGEAEPLRRFNIFLTETRVAQKAMAESGKENASALTQQEKALARYQLILQDSILAQGNFAATQDELANQTRKLRANFDDLSARVGGVLVPVMSDATEMALLLFDALDKFRGVDFSPHFDFPDPPGWLTDIATTAPIATISPLGAAAVALKKILEDDAKAADAIGRDVRGEHWADVIDGLREQDEARAKAAADANRASRRARAEFETFVKGMGLKLDQAQLTAGLDDDVAALRALERAILRRIQIEGRTFKLAQLLVDTRLSISSLIAQQAAAADRKEEEQLEQARRQRESRRDRLQELQFLALGLTAEGEQRGPSVRNLRQRLASLREQVSGTFLDTDKTRSQLKRIGRVLSGEFGNVGREVRSAIQQMFRDINDALNQGTKDNQRTPFRVQRTRDIVRGLGLSGDALRELQMRLARRGPGGTIPGEGTGAFGFALPGAGGTTIIVNGDIRADNPDMFIREVEKRSRRKRKKRSGTRAGGG